MVNKKKIKLGSNRVFGLFFGVIFIIIAFYPLINNGDIRYWSLTISLLFFVLGILNSRYLSPLNRLWFEFGILLGKIFSPVIMLLIFFVVVTPIGLIMRLLGKDLLNLKKNNNKSYWMKKDSNNQSMKDQF